MVEDFTYLCSNLLADNEAVKQLVKLNVRLLRTLASCGYQLHSFCSY